MLSYSTSIKLKLPLKKTEKQSYTSAALRLFFLLPYHIPHLISGISNIFVHKNVMYLYRALSLLLFFIFSCRRNTHNFYIFANEMSSDWRVGLFGCMHDSGLCFDNWCCAPCQISRQLNALDGQRDTCDLPKCLLSCLLPPVAWVCIFKIRRDVVNKYHIDEGTVGSVLKCLCCPACNLCQTQTELTLRGTWPGGTCCEKQPCSVPN